MIDLTIRVREVKQIPGMVDCARVVLESGQVIVVRDDAIVSIANAQ